ncbi:MAG TPA: class I SAM-dependent methyltransferase [Burkholderiales bacterium]|nr:class I SAM-dependent methyltransferase [Burkholderiales bacterium]
MPAGKSATFREMRRRLALACALLVAGCAAGSLRPPDVRYEPTPMEVVGAMLELATLRPEDVVADLGCGDGRLVIEAVRRGAARGLCVDIDRDLIAKARDNARAAGVADRIAFINEDLFTVDLRGVSVVTLFLSPHLNRELRPKLLRELAPGARVVSHWHDMGDWRPQRTLRLRPGGGRERPIYLWVIPSSPAPPRASPEAR